MSRTFQRLCSVTLSQLRGIGKIRTSNLCAHFELRTTHLPLRLAPLFAVQLHSLQHCGCMDQLRESCNLWLALPDPDDIPHGWVCHSMGDKPADIQSQTHADGPPRKATTDVATEYMRKADVWVGWHKLITDLKFPSTYFRLADQVLILQQHLPN